MNRPHPTLALALALAACPASDDTGAPCDPQVAVFTDIDETLTTSDGEWFDQLADPTHDPAMRPEADALMGDYEALGYTPIYITARGEEMNLTDGRTAREATVDWLGGHGFPLDEALVYLAPGLGASGSAAVAYKAGVIDDLVAAGWATSWAYGNAESDILAFQEAGIADDHIFLVGELAGTLGVQPLPDEQAFAAHRAAHMPGVEEVRCE